jgi:hypothetical protein
MDCTGFFIEVQDVFAIGSCSPSWPFVFLAVNLVSSMNKAKIKLTMLVVLFASVRDMKQLLLSASYFSTVVPQPELATDTASSFLML